MPVKTRASKKKQIHKIIETVKTVKNSKQKQHTLYVSNNNKTDLTLQAVNDIYTTVREMIGHSFFTLHAHNGIFSMGLKTFGFDDFNLAGMEDYMRGKIKPGAYSESFKSIQISYFK